MPTNSKSFSQKRQATFFDETPKPGKLIFRMVLPGLLPSWNEMLGMEHWARAKFKGGLADNFEFLLRRVAKDSSTTTTHVKNSMSIYCDTLVSFRATAAKRRALRSFKKKLELASKKKSSSKSLKSEKVPF